MKVYPRIPHTEVWEKIKSGAAVVTVNRRLARHLAAEYAAANMAAGLAAWETPAILPYSVWIETMYDTLLLSPDLESIDKWPDRLSLNQELWIWESVIRESQYGEDLLQVQATAKTAQQAWAICQQWQLDANLLCQAPPPDTAAFIDWCQRFVGWCQSENWVEAVRLPDFLASGIQQELIALPDSIIFAGFDEVPPQMQALLSVIQKAGNYVLLLELPAVSSQVIRYELPDTEAEITHAACWIRQQLSEAPAKRIGVIVPDLQAVRNMLIRIFDDILHPDLVFSEATDPDKVYNVSLGPPLADYPMIRTALTVLETVGSTIAANTISELLRSPFLGGAETELASRSLLDAVLRKSGETEFDIPTLKKAAKRHGCSQFLGLLNEYQAASLNLPTQQRPAKWTDSFTALLSALEWPGDRTLSSMEYQTLEAWQEALSRFAAMDRVVGDISHDHAIKILKRNLVESAFQPETGDRPVQVMGVLESVGAIFDALWVMDLHNEAWPPPPRPNPLIPIWIQRKYNILHSSSERELEYAAQLTDRLAGAAPAVIFSNPRRSGDAELFPSPLIRRFPLATPGFANNGGHQFWRDFLRTATFDRIPDLSGPEVAEGEFVGGGTGLLKAQADCPFKAFAKYRLKAEPLETPVSGLTAAERGSLVHKSLEMLWEDLETHESLLGMPEKQLAAAIEKSVSAAIRHMAPEKPRTFTERFTALEINRLIVLIREWLEQECARAPFVVRDREAMLPVTLCGFGLKTYADRIDQLPDGRLVIIDYKTGTPALKDWFADRMAEPQLPLYAISMDEPVAAILFGQVRKGEARFIGIADDDAIAPGVRTIENDTRYGREYASVADLLPQWRIQLETLGDEVKSGYAAVSPVAVHLSCRYCDLGPICRISESDSLESDSETER